MKKAVLDTNFILTCVKQKITLFDDIRTMGYSIVIPEEVLNEIKRLEKSGKKLHVRDNAKLTLKIIERNEFERMELGDNNVDRGLINLAKEDKDVIVATIDKDLKYKIDRPVLIVRGKKKIEVI